MTRMMLFAAALGLSLGACKPPEIPRAYAPLVPEEHKDLIREVKVDHGALHVFYKDSVTPAELIAAFRTHLEAAGYGSMAECGTPDSGLNLIKAPNHEIAVSTWPMNMIKVIEAESKTYSLPRGDDCTFTDHAKSVCAKLRERSCTLKTE